MFIEGLAKSVYYGSLAFLHREIDLMPGDRTKA
jgi:hypothetical protein